MITIVLLCLAAFVAFLVLTPVLLIRHWQKEGDRLLSEEAERFRRMRETEEARRAPVLPPMGHTLTAGEGEVSYFPGGGDMTTGAVLGCALGFGAGVAMRKYLGR